MKCWKEENRPCPQAAVDATHSATSVLPDCVFEDDGQAGTVVALARVLKSAIHPRQEEVESSVRAIHESCTRRTSQAVFMKETANYESGNNATIVGHITRYVQILNRMKDRLIPTQHEVTTQRTLPLDVPECAYTISSERVTKKRWPLVSIERQATQFSNCVHAKSEYAMRQIDTRPSEAEDSDGDGDIAAHQFIQRLAVIVLTEACECGHSAKR